VASQEAERAYQLWKARQVADQQGSGAVAVVGEGGEEREAKAALLDFALNALKGDLFPDLMEYMWGSGAVKEEPSQSLGAGEES
jgi:hypothetical protein